MNKPTSSIKRWTIGALATAGVLTAAPLLAAGGSSAPPPPAAAPADPAVTAVRHYNSGVEQRKRAWKLSEKLAAAGDDGERAKLEKKIAKAYRRAESSYQQAVRLDPSLHQAHSDLGYVLRKQGRYDDALAAYDRALALAPTYAEAIEYRGEAYLGLNRVEDAQAAYMKLFASDRQRADQLLAAMKQWLAARQADPAGVDGGTLESVAAWLAEREQIAAYVPAPVEQQARAW